MALNRLRTDELAYTWIDDRGTPLQIALLGVFDAGPFLSSDDAVDIARIREELAVRAARVEPLGRRVIWTRPGEGRPVWTTDPMYDPRDHVAASTLPAGADLPGWAATRAVQRLDRNRPLWRAEVVDGLPDGRFAVLVVVSHVLADGLAAVALAGALLDPDPAMCVEGPALVAPPPLPSHRDLVRDHLRQVRSALRRVRPRGGRTRTRPGLRQIREALAGFAGPEPVTSLPRNFGPYRRLAVVRCPLDELQRTAHAQGVTVNDLLLAAVTEGLGRLLTARGENRPEMRLRCSVPATLDRPGRQVASMVLVPLPVDEPDPLRRLALIHESTAAGKRQLRETGQDLTDLRLPTPVARWFLRAARRLGSRRLTLSVTDIPGPTASLWLAGARMVAAVPIAPLAPLVPLSVAALSYAGELTVSVNADPAVADLNVLARGVEDSFAELAELTRARATPPGAPQVTVRGGRQ
jgi:diacylglycerol O-acyltransferase